MKVLLEYREDPWSGKWPEATVLFLIWTSVLTVFLKRLNKKNTDLSRFYSSLHFDFRCVEYLS